METDQLGAISNHDHPAYSAFIGDDGQDITISDSLFFEQHKGRHETVQHRLVLGDGSIEIAHDRDRRDLSELGSRGPGPPEFCPDKGCL